MAKQCHKWTKSDVRIMLRLVKQYPTLYSRNHPDYKVKAVKRKAYESIKKALSVSHPNFTIREISNKLSQLRSAYKKEKEYSERTGVAPFLYFYNDFVEMEKMCEGESSDSLDFTFEECSNPPSRGGEEGEREEEGGSEEPAPVPAAEEGPAPSSPAAHRSSRQSTPRRLLQKSHSSLQRPKSSLPKSKSEPAPVEAEVRDSSWVEIPPVAPSSKPADRPEDPPSCSAASPLITGVQEPSYPVPKAIRLVEKLLDEVMEFRREREVVPTPPEPDFVEQAMVSIKSLVKYLPQNKQVEMVFHLQSIAEEEYLRLSTTAPSKA